MEAAATFNMADPDDHNEYFVMTATRQQWQEIVRNVDGIGHSPAMLRLLAELKSWGIEK